MYRKLFISAGVLSGMLPFAAAAKNKDERPNLLFIMTDQQRYDALGIVGKYDFLKTPNLDRLARESAWFTHAYTPCAVSGPARSCILTGLLVEHTRVFTNELTAQDPVANGFTVQPTFDAILAENGYYSEYHGKWHAPIGWTDCYQKFRWHQKNPNNPFSFELEPLTLYRQMLREKYGKQVRTDSTLFDNSMFNMLYDPDPIDRRIVRGYGPDGELLPEELARRIHTQPDNHGMMILDDDDSYTAYQCREAIDALHRACAQDKPFNITLSINYPHAPMLPTRIYHEMYKVEDMPVPESIADPLIGSPYKNQNAKPVLSEYSDPDLIRYMMKNYFGLVSEIDYWVGQVLDELDKSGKAGNTIVVFVSDHGEMLGSHGMREKNVFFEESARVPLMIRYPEKIKPVVCEDNVSTVDLFGTILDYTGVSKDSRDGRSLRKVIEGRQHRKYVVTEWLYNGIHQPSHMITDGEWKLFLNYSKDSHIRPVLFNLAEDPFEMNDLLSRTNPDRKDYLPVAEQLRKEMVKWLEQRDSEYSALIEEVPIK